MNCKLRDKLILVATCLALLSAASFGQVLKGSISGTVTDPQGAVVSGAQVKATNTSTGAPLTTTTDGSGLFHFNLIPVGDYKVEVSAPGFKTAVQNQILVTARDTNVGAIKLTVGETNTTVEVTADAPLIETNSAQVTNTFAGTTLTTFAGVQENEGLDNLALFVPGVVSVRDNSFSNTNGGQGFSVNGLRGRNNDQQIDGQNNNDNSVAGPGLFVSDAEFVQQYVLVTNQFGPEYGRNAGSVVNIITKSGGNAWHGSIYGNENNSILNSMNNFQKRLDSNASSTTHSPFTVDAAGNPLTKPPRLNDEFAGFTIGGPLVKNKLFLFGGFDEEITSTKSLYASSGLTPTPAGLATLAGCFPTSTALAAFSKVGPFSISGGNPQAFNTSLHTVGTTTSVTTPCAGVQFGQVERILQTPFHGFNFTNRVDYQAGSDTFMARYLFNRGNNFNLDLCTDCAASGFPTNVPALSQAVLFGWTRNLSSKMVNEARIGFNRLNVDFGGNNIGTVPTADAVDQAITRVTFRSSGLLPIGPPTNIPQSRIVNTWQAQDNWNYVMGKHTLKAGVNYTFQRSPNIFLPTINGAFRFGLNPSQNPVANPATDSINLANSWGNFVSNVPDRVQLAAGNPSLDFREHDTFLYGGDDWKIGRNLTVNLGLTWSYYGQPANLFNQIAAPREANPATALWATTQTAATGAGANVVGQPIPLNARVFPIFPAPKNSFGPSVGFAYSPQWGGFLTGHGKTVFRGGYRMLYDPPFYNIYLNMASSAPQVFTQSFTAAQSATKPLPTTPTGPNVRGAFASSLAKGVFDPRSFADTTMAPNFGPDKVHSWSFGLERELTKKAVVEARYVGNKGKDLFQSVNGNPSVTGLLTDFPKLVPAGVTPCSSANAAVRAAVGRADCNQGIVRTRNNGGYSDYNAVQTEFRANNLFKQLTIRSAYTYAKTLDNVSEIFSTFGGGNSITFAQNPFDTKTGEHSFSGLDIPHQWTILATEELPFFKEQHGLMGHILGGWGLSGNYILASGQRYTPAQIFAANAFANGNYYDVGFLGAFNSGVDTARPFLGNINAPATAVGAFAPDACNVFGTGCSITDPNQLVLLVDGTPVNKSQVRYILNSAQSQTVFGTPFGNAPRNSSQDAITNVANFTVMKRVKMGEHASFEFRMSALNVLNHPNFSSVDPFLEDVGDGRANDGFGDPKLSNTTYPGYNNATRRVNFGGTIRF
ncbi:MAG TPA: carboxypeptidase regulatory-like domain-containing protein [Candidatus Angelobacter sp.]|nr:carboxypeptidase regulatory-like domain-containing protein [Candidatus Angelobacter sp.]